MTPKPFKRPPKKYEPKGLSILYEDRDILVVDKINGLLAGDKKYGEKEKGVKRLCLHSASISLVHPFSKEPMTFETKIPAYFESLVRKG